VVAAWREQAGEALIYDRHGGRAGGVVALVELPALPHGNFQQMEKSGGGAPGRLSRSSNSRPCRTGIPSKWKYPGVTLWIWHMGHLLTSPSGCSPTCTLVRSVTDCGMASARAAPCTPGSALGRRNTSSKKASIFGFVS